MWKRLATGGLYGLAALFFNGFPLPHKEPGVRQMLRYMGELASDGVSILIFPEGHRTEHGEIKAFQPVGTPCAPGPDDGVERGSVRVLPAVRDHHG